MKSAFDYKSAKSVKAFSLTYDGEFSGRIVSCVIGSRESRTTILTIVAWKGPIAQWGRPRGNGCGTGWATGRIKELAFGAAFDQAIRKIRPAKWSAPDLAGTGVTGVENYLDSLGYVSMQVM